MALKRRHSQEEDDHDARTIFCANLSEKVTEALLYELFLQGGPVERVSIPKDKEGAQRTFGFITYKHIASVKYAMGVFTGTKLFNRDLRLNNRNANSNNRNSLGSNPQQQQQQLQQQQHQPQRHPHDYQIQQNATQIQMQQFLNTCNQPIAMTNLAALQGVLNSPINTLNSMQPKNNHSAPKKDELPQFFDTSALLEFGSQMIHGLPQPLDTSLAAGSNNHQSKILHRHENRPHNQNNYSRRNDYDNDRRNDRDRRTSRWDRVENRDRDRRDRDRDRSDRDKDKVDRLDRAHERLDREREKDREYNRRNRNDRRN